MKRFLKKRELARQLKVGLRTVDKWIAERKVPYLKIGHVVRFDLAKVKVALARYERKEVTLERPKRAVQDLR